MSSTAIFSTLSRAPQTTLLRRPVLTQPTVGEQLSVDKAPAAGVDAEFAVPATVTVRKWPLGSATTIFVPVQAVGIAEQAVADNGAQSAVPPTMLAPLSAPVATSTPSSSSLSASTGIPIASVDFLNEMAEIEDQLPPETKAILEEARQTQRQIEAEQKVGFDKAKIALQAYVAKQKQALEQFRQRNARLDGALAMPTPVSRSGTPDPDQRPSRSNFQS